MSDPKPNGLILEKIRKTNKVEPVCNSFALWHN